MDTSDKKVLHKSILALLILAAVFIIIVLISGKEGVPLDNVARTFSADAILNVRGQNLVAAVADSDDEREQGLAGTHFLNDKSAMFFVFDESDEHGFWMKGMTIPIDIIWLNELYQIVHIEENVEPSTYPKVLKPSAPAKYGVEVNAGWVARNGVKVGDVIIYTPVQK